MKKAILWCGFFASPALAQYTYPASPGSGGVYVFGTVSAIGALGQSLSYVSSNRTAVATHTLEWHFAGTAPSVCTLELQGSLDNVNWYSLTGSQSCTTPNMVHVVQRAVAYVRANVITYTAGDGTTKLTVSYARGDQ